MYPHTAILTLLAAAATTAWALPVSHNNYNTTNDNAVAHNHAGALSLPRNNTTHTVVAHNSADSLVAAIESSTGQHDQASHERLAESSKMGFPEPIIEDPNRRDRRDGISRVEFEMVWNHLLGNNTSDVKVSGDSQKAWERLKEAPELRESPDGDLYVKDNDAMPEESLNRTMKAMKLLKTMGRVVDMAGE